MSSRAVFPNEEEILYSGSSGNIILSTEKSGSIVIPQTATFEIQDKVYVYKVIDGKATSAQVNITRVNEGLKAGDVIVAEGVGLLREGTPIQVKQ